MTMEIGSCRSALTLVSVALTATLAAQASDSRQVVVQSIDARAQHYGDISRQIWELAELGYKETKSSALLRDELKSAGFRLEDGVAGMPTAFVASWGSGKPVIALMGEFDALPGLSQETVPEQKTRVAGGAGHGCGHNLFGVASMAAAIAVKQQLETRNLPGTVRFYGTPAEEGGNGKVYMVRAGLFDDVDVALHWHPSDRNVASRTSTLAVISAKFRFKGVAAHAASAPDKGRSALDAVMIMTHAVDLLREHIPQESRLHYIITRGGVAPNIVPEAAEIYMYARHPRIDVLDGIWERIIKAAEAGALATGTTMAMEIVGSTPELLPNEALISLIDRNLRQVGGVTYSADERAFAAALQNTFAPGSARPIDEAATVRPPEEPLTIGSTDAADVSWVVPSGWLQAATYVPGTPGHTWQATACTGGSIGRKGMMVAAKTLALTAMDLLTDPAQVSAARASFEKTKAGRPYQSRIPAGAKPPLGYRDTK
jgi:aminobenzoyl-glutamate utilization protein B